MTHEQALSLTPGELAEAEAASDITDADPGASGGPSPEPAATPLRPTATDTELAFAESESDLCHSEPAR